MTIERDVGQLLWLGFEGLEPPLWLAEEAGRGELGAVVLFQRNLAGSQQRRADLEAIADLTRALHDLTPRDAPPLLIAVDQEGGRVARVREPATVWPPMLALSSRSAELVKRVGLAMGEELSALGFDIDFAPVLDVHTHPDNPVIGDRAFATEPDQVAELALAFAEGLSAAGLLPCGKHFPGHGDTDTDSHLALPRLPHDMERLRRVELLPFAAAASRGLPMLMTAHVVFEAVDPERPATLSPAVLGGILRGELGYRGVVVSDDLDMKAIADHYGAADAAIEAIEAGCDALLLCQSRDAQVQAREALIRRAESHSEFRARVGEAADRVRNLSKVRRQRVRPGLDVVGSHRDLAESLGGTRGDLHDPTARG